MTTSKKTPKYLVNRSKADQHAPRWRRDVQNVAVGLNKRPEVVIGTEMNEWDKVVSRYCPLHWQPVNKGTGVLVSNNALIVFLHHNTLAFTFFFSTLRPQRPFNLSWSSDSAVRVWLNEDSSTRTWMFWKTGRQRKQQINREGQESQRAVCS